MMEKQHVKQNLEAKSLEMKNEEVEAKQLDQLKREAVVGTGRKGGEPFRRRGERESRKSLGT